MDTISKVKNDGKNKKKISWRNIELAVLDLSIQIKEKYPDIKTIYGIPRGGLIIAVMLSHKLNIRLSQTIPLDHSDLLIVDDIIDSGNTMQFNSSLKTTTASILYRKTSNFKPDVYVKDAEDYWWVFPWEV